MKIITLTLNPAFDMHCKTENFRLGHESFFDITSFEAGGKGINISRALLANGVKSTAIVVVGNDNGNEFCSKLNKDGIDYKSIFVEGRIRENIILHDNSDIETRVSFNGFEVNKTLFNKVIEKIGNIDNDTLITLTGSNPNGISIDDVKNFVKVVSKNGAKVVIDSRSFSLNDIVDVKPFLIKPNQDEISKYIGREVLDFNDAKKIATDLYKKGIENVMISLGSMGAVLSNKDGVFYLKPPKIKMVSTIGAGDSSVAGFIKAYFENKNGFECLKNAIAFGSGACLMEGTNPPTPDKILQVYNEI